MNLNSVLIGSEDSQRLTDSYAKLFGAPGWSLDDLVASRYRCTDTDGRKNMCSAIL